MKQFRRMRDIIKLTVYGRDVLIAPVAIERIDDTDMSMRINLTMEHIEHAPSIESTKAIWRQFEEAY
jgi:hypothetical protein